MYWISDMSDGNDYEGRWPESAIMIGRDLDSTQSVRWKTANRVPTMQITETTLEGVLLIRLDPFTDERGSFARTYSRDFFREHGLPIDPAECNVVWNGEKGVLRGLHRQVGEDSEVKVVHCLSGEIHDVVIDLRPDSPTYGRSLAHRLSAANPTLLVVPQRCAHGYQTLEPGSCVYYFMSRTYAPQSERGVRWNDPAFGIEWPIAPPILSERDSAYPNFNL